MREGKVDKNRTKLMVGGEKTKYPRECGTPKADLLTVKLFLSRAISTLGYKFVISDIKNFYLNTLMVLYKYIWLKLNSSPEYFIK